ncbi:MAG: hypothetical protein CMP53_09435 [Flavobacteriales bacterium]|nr:hypothetical protein [Flavobacteriales bacterium]
MAGIGGLDVSYGARHQIVRTNVAIVNCDSAHYLTENAAKCIFDLLHQGLGGTILEPDFICPILAGAPATGAWGTGLTTAATSIFEVDTTGNGTADSTSIAKGPLLRNLAQMPLAKNGAVSSQTGTATANTGAVTTAGGDAEVGGLVLEAVLNTGVAQLGDHEGATTAFGAATTEAGATASIALERATEFAGAVQSAAMAASFNGLEDGDARTAGSPEAAVGLLDATPLGAALIETAIQGGAVMPDLNTDQTALVTIFDDFATNGRAQANAGAGKANFGNLMGTSDGTQAAGLCMGIGTVVSIAKVL